MTDDQGCVTEGTAANAWIVMPDNEIITRQADNGILSGITRHTLIQLIEKAAYKLSLRPFTVDEAKSAKEAFFSSSTATVKPVISIDGVSVGNGVPGEITCQLIDLYYQQMHQASSQNGS